MARFIIRNEVRHPAHSTTDWHLVFHDGWLNFDDGTTPPQFGYRFMWRHGDSSLSPRPARIDSLHDILTLLQLAVQAGWGLEDGKVHGVARQSMTVAINGVTFVLPP